MASSFDIDLGSDGTVTGLHYTATGDPSLDTTIMLAHGAGAPQRSPFITAFATGLAELGVDAVTFNFPYMERGRKAPDPKSRLEATYRAAIETTRSVVTSAAKRLVVGGKSMGGRIATQVVAADSNDLGVAGVVTLGYPLHPPGRPDRRRDAHLPSIGAPILFIQGSRDAFGSEEEMRPVAGACPQATLHIVSGGDHSLKIRGKDAPAPSEVYKDLQRVITTWLRTQIL